MVGVACGRVKRRGNARLYTTTRRGSAFAVSSAERSFCIERASTRPPCRREKLASSEERRRRAERAKGDVQRALAAAVDANR